MRILFGVVALALCFMLGLGTALGPRAGRAASGTLSGSVGPGFTISLNVSSVEEGTYDISVDDQSAMHNFDLIGPGGSVFSTAIAATGTFSGSVALTPGTWTYQCDAHPDTMHGSFTVTAAASTTSSSSTDSTTSSTTSTTSTTSSSTSTTSTSTTSTSTMSSSTSTTTPTSSTTPTTTPTSSTQQTSAASTATSTPIATTATEPTATLPTTSMTTTSTTVSGAAGVRVGKPAVHNRVIEVAVASNARASAQMTLLKRGVALAKARAALRPGRNVLRLRAPRRAHGRYLLVVAVRVTGARPIVVRKVVRIP